MSDLDSSEGQASWVLKSLGQRDQGVSVCVLRWRGGGVGVRSKEGACTAMFKAAGGRDVG